MMYNVVVFYHVWCILYEVVVFSDGAWHSKAASQRQQQGMLQHPLGFGSNIYFDLLVWFGLKLVLLARLLTIVVTGIRSQELGSYVI